MALRKFVVSTSIFDPSPVFKKIAERDDLELVVVGDLKTPSGWKIPGVTYLSVPDQKKMGFDILNLLPWNHYSRKLIGYLYSIKKGADIIIDIDDDNLPNPGWGTTPKEGSRRLVSSDGPVNAYSFFTKKHIWPRGFPLEFILSEDTVESQNVPINNKLSVGIWQFLVNGDTDVDAIYRLTINETIMFEKKTPLLLSPGTWCPFNSQNTLFTKEMFPLLYLPGFVNFRFTDILRGLVAQPIMWSVDKVLGFASANAKQDRNPHDLLKDFESEIPCYLHSTKIMNIVQKHVKKKSCLEDNLLRTYGALEKEGVIKEAELNLLRLWLSDLRNISS